MISFFVPVFVLHIFTVIIHLSSSYHCIYTRLQKIEKND